MICITNKTRRINNRGVFTPFLFYKIMFYFTHDNGEEYLITSYSVEHDYDNNSYDVYLYITENGEEIQIEHEEFIKYEEVEKYLNKLLNQDIKNIGEVATLDNDETISRTILTEEEIQGRF